MRVHVSITVALIVRKGGCSIKEKAIAASTLIYPPNLVKYIIVDGERGIQDTSEWAWEVSSPEQQDTSVGTSSHNSVVSQPDVVSSDRHGDDKITYVNHGNWVSYHSENEVGAKSIDTDEDWPPISSSIAATNLDGDDQYGANTQSDDNTIQSSTGDADTDEDWPAIQSTISAMEDDEIDDTNHADNDNKLTDEDWPPLPTDDTPQLVEGDGPNADPTMFAIETHEDLSTDDEPYMDGSDDNISRGLRHEKKHKNEDHEKIRIAVLHVSYSVGYELLDLVAHESTRTRQSGGPKIIMDNKEPPTSAKTIFLWVLLSATLSASACCCLLLCVNRTIFEEEGPPPPPRPVRRRLTYEQVRANHPAFLYHEGDPTMAHEIDCSICLDEFAPGDRLRRLPCNHTFHGNCVARWLIERSAVCPLCKLDLYEEEDDSSSSSGSSDGEGAGDETANNRTGFASWRDFMARYGEDNPQTVTAQPQPGIWSFWSSRQVGADPATAAAPDGTNAASPTTDDVQDSQGARRAWWPFPASPRIAAVDGSETIANENEDEPAGNARGWARMNWFGGRRRRQQSEGRLTELTEPLLPASATSDAEEGHAQAAEVAATQDLRSESVADSQPPQSAASETPSDTTAPSQETPEINPGPATSDLPPSSAEV